MPTPISADIVPWPASDAARYAAEGYWAGVPLGTLLRAAADRTPGAGAVADPVAGVRLTHGELADRADAAARSFTPDGWYRSGDICRFGAGGNLIVEGRDKDMINRGGEKISAEEVENLVYRLPGVSQVAAVAMPDPVLGERVCLYVVPRPGFEPSLAAIRQSMEDAGVARFKLPEHLVVTGALPVTKVGKVDKKALRADIAARSAGLRSYGRGAAMAVTAPRTVALAQNTSAST
jgi:non-ribosomal peptide synthetase component E (peptide arylation enzyme)